MGTVLSPTLVHPHIVHSHIHINCECKMIPVFSIWFIMVQVWNACSWLPALLLRQLGLAAGADNGISPYPLTDAPREEVAVSVSITMTCTFGLAGDTVISRQGHREWIGSNYSNERHKRCNGKEAHLSNI